VTTVAIHQPNYLPWLGFFAKTLRSDVLVILDNVQYERRGYTNRVKIKMSQGAHWLTQPVITKGRYYQQVRDVEFACEDWPTKHLRALQLSYGHAPYFGEYFGAIEDLLREPGSRTSECNERLIRWVLDVLGVRTVVVRASDLVQETTDATRRLIDLVQAMQGDTYLSGAGGFTYQDLQAFEQAGIRVERSSPEFAEYPQLWGPFVRGLSVLDLLFNCGPRSRGYLDQSGQAA
jgi:WbqC-like protein family